MPAVRLARPRRSLAIAAAALLPLAACGEPPTASTPRELTALPRALTTDERAAVTAGNDFSVALFRAVNARKAGENVFVSPLSASVALGMTLNGAAGETFDAMRATLGLDGYTPQQINEAYRGLTTLLLGLDPSVTIGVANAIFHRQGFPVEPAFVEASRTWFDAEVRGLDFADAPAALAVMNDWARERTNGRIEQVLDELRPDEVMFLMNALHFKGVWRTRFDPAQTTPQPFTRDDGTQTMVPMMRRAGVPAREGFVDQSQVVELPYGNGAFAMTVVLPPPGMPVDAYVAALTPERWATLLAALRDRTLDVHLPRFRIEFEDEWKDVLTTLGMGVAFDPGRADLSRISSAGGLYISRVQQNAVVEVNEEGTEAAAVTTVGIGLVSAPPSFRADRPFVFAIRERLSGTLLFVGKVAQP